MNYAIIENESVCEDLERIACWLREKDENLSPKIRKRLDKLANNIIRQCSSCSNRQSFKTTLIKGYSRKNS